MRRINKPRRVINSIDDLPILCDCVEAGLLLRRNPEAIAQMARLGVLKGAKQGQAWFFRRDDLMEYLNKLFNGKENDAAPVSAHQDGGKGTQKDNQAN